MRYTCLLFVQFLTFYLCVVEQYCTYLFLKPLWSKVTFEFLLLFFYLLGLQVQSVTKTHSHV